MTDRKALILAGAAGAVSPDVAALVEAVDQYLGAIDAQNPTPTSQRMALYGLRAALAKMKGGAAISAWNTRADAPELAALRVAYRLGFEASAKGWNGEYPFDSELAEANAKWTAARDRALASLGG